MCNAHIAVPFTDFLFKYVDFWCHLSVLNSLSTCFFRTILVWIVVAFPVLSRSCFIYSAALSTCVGRQSTSPICCRVDADRINDVGPDRACAEWLLRCGAHFRWRSQPGWQTDYNALSPTRKKQYIEEINADNAAIMDIGFQHFSELERGRQGINMNVS